MFIFSLLNNVVFHSSSFLGSNFFYIKVLRKNTRGVNILLNITKTIFAENQK